MWLPVEGLFEGHAQSWKITKGQGARASIQRPPSQDNHMSMSPAMILTNQIRSY